MHRSLLCFVLLIVLLVPLIPVPNALGQSGRGRRRVTPPPPSTSPVKVKIPEASTVIKQEKVNDVSRFVLRNGVTVVIDEQHATAILAASAFIKRPANYQVQHRNNARLLQSVLLHGSAAHSGASKLRELGGCLSGETSDDGSAYYLVAPSSELKKALSVQYDILQNSKIDPDDVLREARLDAAARKAPGCQSSMSAAVLFSDRAQELTDSVFGPVQDPDTNPGATTPETLLEYYRSAYRPENLVLVLVGDIVPYNALIEIQQLYGRFGADASTAPEQGKSSKVAAAPPAAGRALPRETMTQPPYPTQQNAEDNKLYYAAERTDATQSLVSVGFRVPGMNSADWAPIEVLTGLLARGRASRLTRALVDGPMAAARVDGSYFASGESGLLLFRIWPVQDPREGGTFDQAESAVFRELDRIRREVPGEGDMIRATSVLEQEFADQTSSYLLRAIMLSRTEAARAGIRAAIEYRNRIRAVRAEDVQRVAAKYLTIKTTMVHEMEAGAGPPRTFDAERFDATVKAWAPGFAQSVDQSTVRPADPKMAPVAQGVEKPERERLAVESLEPLPVKDFSTLNGPRAFVREDHSAPLVTIGLLFQGGRVIEEPNNSGITELMLRSMVYGTPRRSYAQVTEELEQLGARLEPVVESDFFGFSLCVLSRNADRVLRILRDIIEEPSFREDDVKRAIVAQLAAVRRDRDSIRSRSRELLMTALFPGHAYSQPVHGREETVAKLTPEMLIAWHTRLVNHQFPLVVIVGDTEGSSLISGQLAEGFRRRDLDTSLKVRVPMSAPASQKMEQRGTESSAIAIGVFGPRSTSGDQTALELIAQALNGPDGRLELELRDKEGLAFGSAFNSQALFSAGAIWIEALTAPEDESRAKAAVNAVFQKLSRSGLSEDELAGAQAAALGARLAWLQSQSTSAVEYARAVMYQRPASDVDNFAEQASRITVADTKRVAAGYFKTTSEGIVHGRPRSPSGSPSKQD